MPRNKNRPPRLAVGAGAAVLGMAALFGCDSGKPCVHWQGDLQSYDVELTIPDGEVLAALLGDDSKQEQTAAWQSYAQLATTAMHNNNVPPGMTFTIGDDITYTPGSSEVGAQKAAAKLAHLASQYLHYPVEQQLIEIEVATPRDTSVAVISLNAVAPSGCINTGGTATANGAGA